MNSPDGRSRPGSVGHCARTRDLLPLCMAGVASPSEAADVEVHLATCEECRAEEGFLLELVRVRPEPPVHLEADIVGAVLAEWGGATKAPWSRVAGRFAWTLPAAAMVVLALGIGVFWSAEETRDPAWSMALEPEVSMLWYGNDWMVAGQPVFEALPDDVLRSLIEEFDR